MYCPYCNNEILDDSQFCPECGQTVSQTGTQNVETSTYWINVKKEVERNDIVQSQIEEKEIKIQRQKRKSTVVSMFMIIVLVVCVVFVIPPILEENRLKSNTKDTDVENDADVIDNQEELYENEGEKYILPGSDSKYLERSDLTGLSKEECRIARNELYARHGRKFDDQELQEYFNSCEWYTASIEPDDFEESMLNDYEVANRDLIVAYEEEQGYR